MRSHRGNGATHTSQSNQGLNRRVLHRKKTQGGRRGGKGAGRGVGRASGGKGKGANAKANAKGNGKDGKGRQGPEPDSDTDDFDANAEDSGSRTAGSYRHSHSQRRVAALEEHFQLWNCLGRTSESDEIDGVDAADAASQMLIYHCSVDVNLNVTMVVKRMVASMVRALLASLPPHASLAKWMKFLSSCTG